jgi:hypothetical protein
MESPVHNERCTLGSEGGAWKPADESRHGATRPPYLTGGELDDEPWNGFRYNFDGVPDWARPDFKDRYDREYRTVVSCFLYGGPSERIVDASGEWTLQATYSSSGETECPLRDVDAEEQEAIYTHREKQFNLPRIERCFLCDEERGDDHRYIYLGDGWAECVFRLGERDANYDDEYDDVR